MNDLLEFTGHFIYIVFSILLFPFVLLLQLLFGVLIAVKYIKANYKKAGVIARSKKPFFKLPRVVDLLLHRLN